MTAPQACCICNETVADWKRVGASRKVVCAECIERLHVVTEPGTPAQCEQCGRAYRIPPKSLERSPSICPECVTGQFKPFAERVRFCQADAAEAAEAEAQAAREQVQADIDAEAERVRQAQDADDAAKYRALIASRHAKKGK